MIPALAQLFVSGVELTGTQKFLLLLPICLSIAIVYKTTRCESVRDVPVEALVLWVSIVAGMYAVGLGLWAAYSVMV